ncbi:phosphatidylinositol N-acetylglucosaminyltransferase [Powellomyces hirtus]|uniref:Phosphatidylinositol N-acetylglucosaminyltransferase n=1 Tax=Powellomyces hirtus TaxID=109895 RepID=A0A507E3L0_9FUNG|nr:phosphatidylinositol N-acetylglucosaminyltransferase [Powellomyces hirtus]
MVQKPVLETQPPWRKLLYVKQGYPDNYVDDSFLELMQRNVNVRTHFYWPVVLRTCSVSQHISAIVVFVAVFSHLCAGALAANTLLAIDVITAGAAYVCWDTLAVVPPKRGRQRLQIAQRATLILVTLVGLTPVLQTLTKAISSDTIWALSAILFLANVAFHDYGSKHIVKVRFPDSLSINAAIFASVLLASRLPSHAHVLGLMLFAVLMFVLLPAIRRMLRNVSITADITILAVLVSLSALLFSTISMSLVTMYLLSIVFVNLICPYWLIHAQKYKR